MVEISVLYSSLNCALVVWTLGLSETREKGLDACVSSKSFEVPQIAAAAVVEKKDCGE